MSAITYLYSVVNGTIKSITLPFCSLCIIPKVQVLKKISGCPNSSLIIREKWHVLFVEISSCLVYVTVVVLFQPAAIIFTYTAMTKTVFLLKLGYTKTKEGIFPKENPIQCYHRLRKSLGNKKNVENLLCLDNYFIESLWPQEM